MTSQSPPGRVAGVLAPALLLGTVLGTALVAPGYEWPTEPFSVIGSGGSATALAFNAGLLVSGVLAAVYGGYRWQTSRRLTGAIYALGGLSLAVAGVFPAGTALHEVAAVFLFTAWIPPTVDGVLRWRRNERPAGVTGVLLGLLALGIWLPYDFGVDALWVGYGAAELVTFAAWGAWTAWVAWHNEAEGAGSDAPPRAGS